MRFRFCSILLSTALAAGCANAGTEQVAAEDGSSVRFQAVIAEGAKPFDEPLSWVVTKLREGGAPGKVVAKPIAAAPQLSLAPGRYIVSVRHGDAEAREEIVVGTQDAKHVLDLNAGFIRLDMIPHAGAPRVTRDVTWEVYRYAKGRGADERLKVTAATAPSQRFLLREGYYTIRARYAGTIADMVLNVVAGHQLSYTLNLYAGNVGLSAVAENGSVEDEVTWQIVRAKPGENGKREVVAKTIATAPKLLLREGRYIVLARSGSLAGEAPLEIKAGNTQHIKVELKRSNADG